MKYAKYEAGLGRKGIAIAHNSYQSQTSITAGTDLNYAISFSSTTSNILKVSDNTILLKAGSLYKLTATITAVCTTGSNHLFFYRFYNIAHSQYIGHDGVIYPATINSANYGGATGACAFIAPTADIHIRLRVTNTQSSVWELNTFSIISVTIEELEQFAPKSINTLYCQQAMLTPPSLLNYAVSASGPLCLVHKKTDASLINTITANDSNTLNLGNNVYWDDTTGTYKYGENSNGGHAVLLQLRGGAERDFGFYATSSGGQAGQNLTFDTIFRCYNGSFQSIWIYNQTTSNGANVFVDSDGKLWRSTSAAKYKEDIQDLESGAAIYNLRPITYRAKGDDSGKRWLGFIADEVAKVEPSLVQFGQDGEPEGLDYARITVLLVKEVQKLRKELDELKGKMS